VSNAKKLSALCGQVRSRLTPLPRQNAETPPRTREAAAAAAAGAGGAPPPPPPPPPGGLALAAAAAATPERQTLPAVSPMLQPEAPCRTCSSFIRSSGARVVRETAQEAAPAARWRR